MHLLSEQSDTEITDGRKLDLKLDDREMGLLISGAANHSNKLVLIASMDPDKIYSLSGENSASKLLLSAQNGFEDDGWVPEYSVAFNYFSKSLSPVGMVTKEYIDNIKDSLGYRLSETGMRFGIPLAGLLLDFAYRHELALSQVFGDTTSRNPEARAGEIRWKIFQGLATQLTDVPTSGTELANSIGTQPSRTIDNLRELSEIGIVNYQPGTKRPAQEYDIDIEGLRNFIPQMRKGGARDLAQLIVSRDAARASYTIADLSGAIHERDPAQDTPAFRSYLKTILGNWEDRGYAARQVVSSGDALVWVDKPQQETLIELVQILDDVQNGNEDTLNQGRALASQIVSSPAIVSHLLGHEKRVSVHFHGQENAKLRGTRILDLLHSQGGEMTYDDIEQKLKDMGDIVSKNGIARILKDRSDIIIRSNPGRKSIVSLRE